jgi:hypothetical protein
MLPRRNHAADLARLHTEQFGYYGRPVILPDGREVVGLFALRPTPQAPWPEIGAALRINHVPNPELRLPKADAEGLGKNQALVVDGARYIVVDLDPPDEGLVRVVLLAEPAGTTRPDPAARWQ